MIDKNKHLIVVSVDALVFEDLEYAKELPMFGRLLREGALIERVRTIYPSLTHPVHATLLTGAPAGITGIDSNERFEPGNHYATWYNLLDEIQCDTILHAAKRAGLATAVCTWPVTAKGSDVIDYLVPDLMDDYLVGREDDLIGLFRDYGAREEIIDIVEGALKRCDMKLGHPAFEEFQAYCCAKLIRRYQPNLLFTHLCYVDSMRHRTGVFSDQVKIAVRETDRWLSEIWQAVVDAGIEDSTDFVVLSDHGQMGICRRICPNVFLADRGYIRTDENGELVSWDAYVKTCALSAQVYLSRPDDKKLYDEIYTLLSEMAEEKLYGFERVFTVDEVKERYGLSGGFSFVLENDGFTSFSDEWVRPVVRELNITDYRYGKATHGHMPEKGPQPPFVGMGPSFKKGVVLSEGSILNHAPTFAKILGLELRDAVGKAVEEMLEE